jgi:Mg2+/Co2+ transporter CorC
VEYGIQEKIIGGMDDMHQLPNIDEMTTIEAIYWYTKQITEVTSVKNRVARTYSDEYQQALMQWKKELNRKALTERKSF